MMLIMIMIMYNIAMRMISKVPMIIIITNLMMMLIVMVVMVVMGFSE